MRPDIKNILGLIACLCGVAFFAALLALAGFLHSADRAAQQIVPTVDHRLASIEKTANDRLASIEAKADARIGDLSEKLVHISDKAESDLNAKLDTALALTDAQLTATRADLLAELHPVVGQASDTLSAYAALPRSIQPTVDQVNLLSGPLLRNSLGTVAAAKVTLGDLAKAGRTFEATSLQINRAAVNSAEASKQTAVVMTNFAKATKPLPTWLRIGLAVAPSAAQTAFPLWSMFSK